MSVEIVGYVGPERRDGSDLSEDRAAEIMNALEAAQAELKSKMGSVTARFLRWMADVIGKGYEDVNVSCNFRQDDSAGKIRELFIDSSKLSEVAVVSGRLKDSDAIEIVDDEFFEARSSVLIDLAEILLRAGIISQPREIEKDESVTFTEGHVYKMKVHDKNVTVFCTGFAVKGEHFAGGCALSPGAPIFQFNPEDQFDVWGKRLNYVIGKTYLRQEPAHDVYEEFCGYTRHGEPVMKFLRRKSIEEVGKKADGGFSAGISS